MRRFAAILFLFAGLAPALSQAAPLSPLSQLSDAEKSYYAQSFAYAMETVKPGGRYDWESYSGKGSITIADTYISKSGYTCRNFSETFTVQNQTGAGQGVACKRIGRDGWCKLKTGSALTCALEPPDNVIEEKVRDASEFYNRTEDSTNSWWYGWKNWWSGW